MPKKLTDAEFKTKANEIHNNKYEYPEPYINSSIPINMFCPVESHGLFKQRPNVHINNKQGCPKCGNIQAHEKTKNSLEQIVQKFVTIHGNLYDYSHVKKEEVVNNKSVIKIWCNQCEIFFKQKINNHLNKQGCPGCWEKRRGQSKKIDEKDFLKKARKIHGDKYQYLESYKGSDIPIKMLCPLEGHGIFQKRPGKHINKKEGCPKCAKNRKLTPEIFKKAAEATHGVGTYDYSLVSEIINNKIKIPIICNKKNHGTFWQKSNDHTNGYGCPTCGGLTSKLQKQLYIELKKKIKTDIILEKKILLNDNKHAKADICFPKEKIIVEYNGDYWHCNPKKYKPSYYNSKVHMTAEDIWNKDSIRKKELEDLGYKVFIVWESDFKKDKENTIQKLANEIKLIKDSNKKEK